MHPSLPHYEDILSIDHHIVSAHHPRPMFHGGLQPLSMLDNKLAQRHLI